ncbi:guanine nucleotide exchange factor synembryn-like protein [Parathielavia hyrcaniae]|uniref:Guanine nucleotide exchange factor synembryn-like protein n=1 Tax=Parathielavia hyrcaniae TaxID=113614 RepID=A0AAN6Q2R5_9PEZI|nr:guanine nucleotide exchange factor synembryn-like protein [Parathielavia hyrcaniae]
MVQLPQQAPLGSFAGPAKLSVVKDLLNKLSEDIKSATLQSHERDRALEELKVYGRDSSYADPIFTKEGIETLSKHAFDSTSETTYRNALRVLCNALFLRPKTREIFVDLGYEMKACTKLKNDSRDDEFLASRLLLLTTYGTKIDLPALITHHQLANSITQNLSRHAARFASPAVDAGKTEPMEEMALAETLKLLFNVTNFAKAHINSFDAALPHVTTILCSYALPQSQTPLEPLFGLLINTLLNLDLTTPTAQSSIYPQTEPTRVTIRLLQLLDLSMKSYTDTSLDQSVTPLICALSAVHERAPKKTDKDTHTHTHTEDEYDDSTDPVRSLIRTALLPAEEDRKTVLGRADTLPSRLLRNWTNPLAPQFRGAVAHLYFDLSGRDAGRFIENVGYGYASGFLFENQIPVPAGAVEGGGGGGGREEGSSSRASAAAAAAAGRRPVNPITGQLLDEEKFAEIPEMTDEEKEREAERLFVLFERLRQTGIVSVVNPVATAVQEGRFEELPDDDEPAKKLD